jgi:hypothetical protein
MDGLDYLISRTLNITDKKTVDMNENVNDKHINSIQKRFDELKVYTHVKTNTLVIGQRIRYYDIGTGKLSISGLIVNIEYLGIMDMSHVKTIHLYNKFSDTYWKIHPENYIIFVQTSKTTKNTKYIQELIKMYKHKNNIK